MGRWRALANAAFALAVLALGSFGLYQVATRRWHVQPTFHVRVKFSTVSGLEAGHRVRLQGMDAGVVEQVVAPEHLASRSSSSCGWINGCAIWSARTQSPAFLPRGWSAPRRRDHARPAGRAPGRRGRRD